MLGCAWLWLAEKIHLKWKLISIVIVATGFFYKTMCTITNKQNICGSVVHKGNIKHARAGFALLIVIKIHFFGWNVNRLFVWTCWMIHVQTTSVQTPKATCIDFADFAISQFQEKRVCLFFNGKVAHLIRWRALRTITAASFKRLESFFARDVYLNTLYSEITHSQ